MRSLICCGVSLALRMSLLPVHVPGVPSSLQQVLHQVLRLAPQGVDDVPEVAHHRGLALLEDVRLRHGESLVLLYRLWEVGSWPGQVVKGNSSDM